MESIPERLRATIETFCTDMWEGYLKAIEEFIAEHQLRAALTIDRFHVAQHYHEGFDELRQQELKRLKQEWGAAKYQEIGQGMMWILRPNHQKLNHVQRQRLKRLFYYSPLLHRAYTLRQELTALFEKRLTVKEGKKRLLQWIQKVRSSGLSCFDQAIKTIENHLTWIANYFICRATSGFVEGLNNKLKVIKRRCYGVKKPDSLFQRLWLDLQGYARFS